MTENKTEVTTNEAATYLQVTQGHIRKLVERGDLEANKVGRDLFVTWASLRKYDHKRKPVGRPAERKPKRRSAREKLCPAQV